MITATRCRHCGGFVRRDICFDKKGEPFWTCPLCGKVETDHSWYKYVGHAEAIEVIEHRGRRGLFVEEAGNVIIGIDNSTGYAWVEEFQNLTDCLMWLVDKEAKDDKD
ncbi:MAG: hypothetical protein IKJ99_03210 [Oscillospiraceae bacterium]|nr:hypothetical protein [Oscillospiraceae bacterium]